MQSKDGRGIRCDFCGCEYKTDFDYYSLESKRSVFGQHEKPSLLMARELDTAGEFDMCPQCYSETGEVVKANHRPVKSGIACDFTGGVIAGVFWYVGFSHVRVRLGQSKVCSKCGRQGSGRCRCGNDTYVQPPRSVVNRNVLELALSEQSYAQLVARSKAAKENSEWSTSSE